VAGVARMAMEDRIHRSEGVVCILTGHGLKDPDVVAGEEGSLTPVSADLGSVRRAMDL
jgi:threonine synthase